MPRWVPGEWGWGSTPLLIDPWANHKQAAGGIRKIVNNNFEINLRL